MPGFEKVASITELKDGEVTSVEVAGESIALFRLADSIFATTELCPHADCPLSEYGVIEADEVECTCHGSRFDIRTGENRAPPAVEPLRVYPVQLEGDDVLVSLD